MRELALGGRRAVRGPRPDKDETVSLTLTTNKEQKFCCFLSRLPLVPLSSSSQTFPVQSQSVLDLNSAPRWMQGH